jgi:hypothetical protein
MTEKWSPIKSDIMQDDKRWSDLFLSYNKVERVAMDVSRSGDVLLKAVPTKYIHKPPGV